MEDIQSPMRRNRKKEVISSRQRKIIVDAYNNKLVNLIETLSKELGIGKSAIYQTILQYKRSNKVLPPKRTKQLENIIKIDMDPIYLIKKKVYQFWFNHEIPTFDKIHQVINEDEGLPSLARTSLYRLLKSINFEYVKQGNINAVVEETRIVLLRKKYIKQIRRFREEGRPIYYFTESSIGLLKQNKFKGSSLFYYCHIGSEDGFVPESSFWYMSNNNLQMDSRCIRQWLKSVLPKLKDQAVIVMNDSRPSLKQSYIIDKMVKEHNKYVLRLPMYHDELNPIVLAVSSVRKYLYINGKHKNFPEIIQLIIKGEREVKDMWKNWIFDVIEEENKLWNMDCVVDELMSEREPCVLDVVASDH